MGVMLSAAGSLQWLDDVVAPGVPFDGSVAEAERWEPGAEGLLFLPYLQGERTPHADPDARGAFTGLQLRHDRGRWCARCSKGSHSGSGTRSTSSGDSGSRSSSARASGGGARSRLWLEICASVLGIPIERTAVEEGSAFGAALLGGVRGRRLRRVNEAVEAAVATADVVEPDPGWMDVYAELQARYRALYPALRIDGATVER